MMDPMLVDLLKRLVFSLPFIAIWIAGIIFCIQYRKHHPREATLLITAFVIFIIQMILTQALQGWVMLNMNELSTATVSTFYSILQLVSTPISVIAWVLALMGIYKLLQNKNSLQQPN